MGLTVTGVVNSAEEAIAHAKETSPDLVLLDIHLKGAVDGIAAASTIRERFGIPTVYLASHSDDVTVQPADDTYPSAYLLKPVTQKELEITLRTALQHHPMERRLSEHMEVAAAAHPPRFCPSRYSPSPAPGRSEASPISSESSPSNQAIQKQLQKILSSRTLIQSKRLVRFLSFIVDKGLKGEGRDLNEYLIGVEAYER